MSMRACQPLRSIHRRPQNLVLVPSPRTKNWWLVEVTRGWKFPKSDDFQVMAGVQFLSGRILAKSLLPEPKTSLKCFLAALVSGNKVSFSKKKITFFFFPPSFSKKIQVPRKIFFYCSPSGGGKMGGGLLPK